VSEPAGTFFEYRGGVEWPLAAARHELRGATLAPLRGRAGGPPTGDVVSNGVTWTPALVEDFTVAAGPGAVRAAYPSMALYPEGSGGGKYLADQTVTVHDSIFDIQVRHIGTVDAGAAMAVLTPDPSGTWIGWTGGRFAFRFRADPSAVGYGGVFQLWPTSNVWGEGEMDFPEGAFDSGINLYHHEVGANPQNNYTVAQGLGSWDPWRVAVIEWVPGVSARYYLDGNLVGEVTNPAQVATTAHNFVVQTAAHTDTADGAPDASTGHFQIDWIVIYQAARSGGAAPVT
jgi:hypothetical protein